MTIDLTPAAETALEIRITMTDGKICRFAVDDSAGAQRILKDIQPARLFAVPNLLIGGDASLSVFPTNRVDRVEFLGENLPAWPFLGGAIDVHEVSEAEFRTVYDSSRYAADRRAAGEQPGSTQVGFTEYWTVSGLCLFWQVQMESQLMTPIDFRPYIQALLAAGGLHARTAEGGIAVLNPSNLTRVTYHPGPPVLPGGSWSARRL